jgi:hypothetical protein
MFDNGPDTTLPEQQREDKRPIEPVKIKRAPHKHAGGSE